MKRLDGKVVLITGAARGLGRAMAVQMASEGASIIALDICADSPAVPVPGPTMADLEETRQLVEAAGAEALVRRADVRDPASLDDAVAAGLEPFGRLDIVCANAGVGGHHSAAELVPDEIWATIVDINLSGAWRTAKATIPHLRSGGCIIFTSSVAGLRAFSETSHYVAAKHGVVGLMKTLALELGPKGIRVNAVHPTRVATPLILNDDQVRRGRPDLANPTLTDFEEASKSMHAMPVPWVEPEDVARAVTFLASDEARYITGVSLPIDAGNLVT